MPQLRPCHIEKASALLQKTLAPRELDRIARQTGFVQRHRLVTAPAVFWALVVTLGAQVARYLSDVLRTLNEREGWRLRYKPFWDRLSKRAFARFTQAIFRSLCAEMATRVLRRQRGSEAALFTEIFADDGSSFAVADGLRKVFPGRFKHQKPAAVELHAHMSLLQDNLLSVTLAPDKEAERQFLPAASSLPRGSLSLRDRGYIDVTYFEALEPVGAFLICRAPRGLNPTVVMVHGVSRELAKRWRGRRLHDLPWTKLRRDLEIVVSWSRPQERLLKLRLVVRYVPEKKGWTYLLTNLPRDLVDADTVAQLYRLRWQIELVFKDWKSGANLHAFATEHPAIVEGLIWASLCAAFLKRSLGHWAQRVMGKAISTRLASLAGPQILPQLAYWAQHRFPKKRLLAMLVFLAENAARAQPKRDRTYERHLVGLRFAEVQGG